jgi:hypothetical protein
MGLGGSIALIAIGLILAFAVDVNIAGLDERLIGLILAGAGILGPRAVPRGLGAPPALGDVVADRTAGRLPSARLLRAGTSRSVGSTTTPLNPLGS